MTACRVDAPTSVEGPIVEHELADELRRWSDRQLGTSGYADAHPAACRETCRMSGRLCRLHAEACELGEAHFGDPGYRGLCEAAAQACAQTRARCLACSRVTGAGAARVRGRAG